MKDEWEVYRLEDVCSYITDGAHNSPKSVEFGIPMASVKDMTDFGFDYSACRQISENDYIKLKKGNNEPINRDVLIAKDGSYLKHCFQYKDEPKKVVLLSSIAIFRPDESKVLSTFLTYLFKSPFVKGMARNYVSGVAIPRIVLSDFKKLKLSIPPLPTQRKIAAILSAYDDLIENNIKRIKLLEEKAQLTYEEWFVRMKFPGHETTPIDEKTGLPEGWEKVRIGDICDTSSGGTPSRKKEKEYYENGTIPWVRTGELHNFILTDAEFKITESGLKNSSAKLFPKNTVLLAMYGNTIGETSFVTKEVSSNQACCAFLVKENSWLSYFLHQYLLYNKEYVLNYRMGAAQENISQTIIKNIKIIFPDSNSLISYEKIAKQVYNNIENLLFQNQLLKEARDILLPRLMTRMIDVEKIEIKNLEPTPV